MARGPRYTYYNSMRLYWNADDALAYGSNWHSTLYLDSYAGSKGIAYIDTYGQGRYPALPIWWESEYGHKDLIGWVNDDYNYKVSVPTLNKTSMNIGETVRITFNRQSDNFTHKIWYRQVGKSWTVLASGVTASYWDWSPNPNAILAMLPTSTSGTFEISVETFSGSTNLGESRVTITLKIPPTVVPYLGTLSAIETHAGLLAIGVEGWVKGISKPKASISSATPGWGATSKLTYVWTFHGQTSSAESPTFNASMATEPTIELYVIDSRGRRSDTSKLKLTQVSYSAPVASSFDAMRYDSSNQDKVHISLKAKQTKLGNKNTFRYKIDARKEGTTTWINKKSWSPYQVADFNLSATVISDVPNDGRWQLRVTLQDLLGSQATKILDLEFSRKLWGEVIDGDTLNLFVALKILGNPVADWPIEVGSNYTKWKSGKLECWGTLDVTIGATSAASSIYRSSSNISITFPVAFLDVPAISLQHMSYDYYGSYINGASRSSFNFRLWHFWSNANPTQVSYYAVGRWK